jgi:hypothetical protein
MVGKIGDKKVSGVRSTKEASQIESTGAVSGVSEVKATAGVSGVGGVGAISGKRRATRVMSREEREQLFNMIREEADRLVEEGAIPASQRQVVKEAVLMAVDSGIILDDEAADAPKKGKPKSPR